MKFRRRHLVSVWSLVFGALWWGGCGGGSEESGMSSTSSMDEGPLVANVGGRPVTRTYYETRLERMDREFLPDTLDLAGKRKFLDFIINKELMALKAEEMGIDENPQLISTLKLIEDNMVYKQAIERLVEGKIEPTEEEIQQFYENKKEQVLVKHILVPHLAQAQEAYQKLLDGAEFDQMVEEYSTVPATDSEGLTIPLQQRAVFGWVEYGTTQPWVEEAVFNGELNKPLEPLQTAYGWHIFMPIDRQPKRQEPLSEQRENITTQIKMRKKREISEAYYEKILEEHGFELERATLEFIYDMLPEDLPPDQAPNPETEIKPVIPFSIADRTKLLMKVDGKKYTVGDFSDKYDDTSWFERPKRAYGSLGLYLWIRSGWLKPMQLEYAYEHGVADDPVVVAEVSKRREQMMVNYLHQNLIGSQVPEFTEEEMREFYNEHVDVYVDKEKRIFNLIFHPRERVVRRAYDMIQNGADFVETAIRFNDNATEAHHVQTPAFARDDPDFAEIAEQGWELDLKEIGEPFKTGNGWVLLQYALNIPEEPFEFEEIREFILRDMNSDWSEKRLNELIAEWKQQYEVEIYDDVLADAEVRRDDVVVPGRSATGAE